MLELSINVTNSAPTCTNASVTLPSGASAGYNCGSVSATNGSANTTLNKLYLTLNDVTGQGPDCDNPPAVDSYFTASQTSNGTMTVKTTVPATTIFSGNTTTYGVQVNVEDNGGLKACGNFNLVKGLVSQQIQIYADANIDDVCNQTCPGGGYPFSVWVTKGSSTDGGFPAGGAEPDSMNIYVGNIIYTGPSLATRLFQGTNVEGGIVFTQNNTRYHVANGVITAELSVCPGC